VIPCGGRLVCFAMLLALAALFLSAGPLFAQRRGGSMFPQMPGETGMEVVVPLEYDAAPFDITRTRLPRVYGGNNIQSIFSAVESGIPRSGAGSEARRPAGGSGQAWALSPGSVFAFQVKPSDVAYDKHGQRIWVYFRLWTILAHGEADMDRLGFRIDYVPQVDNKFDYTAANGKKVEVEEVKFTEYTAVFTNLGEFPVEKAGLPDSGQAKGKSFGSLDDALMGRNIVIGAPAGKKEAGDLQRNVRLLVLCRLAEPYATAETVQVRGTPEKPGEYLAQHRYLHVRLLQLWLYDAYTGRVFERIRPAEERR